MNPRLAKWAPRVAYPLAYLVALGVFVNVTFPNEVLKERIIREFDAKQGPTGKYRLEIGEVSPYWLSGIEGKQIRLVPIARPGASSSGEGAEAIPAETEAGEQTSEATAGATATATATAGVKGAEAAADSGAMVIDSFYVSVSVLRYLFGTTKVALSVDAFGGDIEGSFERSEASQKLSLKLSEIDVGRAPMLASAVGLPMLGSLDGSIEVEIPGGKIDKASGSVTLNISNLAVGDGKAKILQVIALPKVDVGTVSIEGTITEGNLRVTKLTASGKDLQVEADGKVKLREPFDASSLDLNLRFKFAEAYQNRNDVTKGVFGTGSTPGLMDMDPKVKRAKRPDGFYGWRVMGTLSSPAFTPAAASSKSGR